MNMNRSHALLPVVFLAGASVVAPAEQPLACNINALSAPQRERHRALGEKLRRSVVERVELSNGYTLVLDPGRLPLDAAGEPYCVVEVAQWGDLEARCCPFLEFGIELPASGKTVRLRLTGGKLVKEFLETELGLGKESKKPL